MQKIKLATKDKYTPQQTCVEKSKEICPQGIMLDTKDKYKTQETSAHPSFIDIAGITPTGLHGTDLSYDSKSIFTGGAEKVCSVDFEHGIVIYDFKTRRLDQYFIGIQKKHSKQSVYHQPSFYAYSVRFRSEADTDLWDKAYAFVEKELERIYNELLADIVRLEKANVSLENKSTIKNPNMFNLNYVSSFNNSCILNKMSLNANKQNLASQINRSGQSKLEDVLQAWAILKKIGYDGFKEKRNPANKRVAEPFHASLKNKYSQHPSLSDNFSKNLQFRNCVQEECTWSTAKNSQIIEGAMLVSRTESISLESLALLIGCNTSGFWLMLKSGVINKGIRDLYNPLPGLIGSFDGQDDIEQSISETADEGSISREIDPETHVLHKACDHSVESSTARERGTVLEQVSFRKPQITTVMKNQPWERFPQMIINDEGRGNEIPRPYGDQTISNSQMGTDAAQQEASRKQPWTTHVTLDSSAETREDNSNPYDTTSMESSREDSVSSIHEAATNGDHGLSLSPLSSLICSQDGHSEMLDGNEEVKPSMNTEQTEPHATLCTSPNDKGKESHAAGNAISCTESKTDSPPEKTKNDDSDFNHIVFGEDAEDLQYFTHSTETDREHSASTFDDQDSLTVNHVDQVSDSATNASHLPVPVQAQSPENYGIPHDIWSEENSSSVPTPSSFSYQTTADSIVCETSSAVAYVGECQREDPAGLGPTQDTPRSIDSLSNATGTTVLQDKIEYGYMGQGRHIIAQPTEEESQPSILPSTADRPFAFQPISCTVYSTVYGNFAPAFGARRQASLGSSADIPDRGVQPPIIVHAAGSRPPRTFTDQDTLDLSQARHPQYSDMRARRATFNRTWDLFDSEADPASMALAGFFRPDAHKPRRVRCFYCGLELDFNGLSGWEEHLRHNPSCQFLRQMGGEQFVKEQQIRRLRK